MNSENNLSMTRKDAKMSKGSLPTRDILDAPVSFWLNLKSQDEEGRCYLGSKWFLKGRVVYRNQENIEILTTFPLEVDQPVMFEKCIDNQVGIVQWSSKVDENTFKVGIKLI